MLVDLPLGDATETYGHLEVYFNDTAGTNCAKTLASGSAYGSATQMGVKLIRCTEPAPVSMCTTDISVDDFGPYQYYAGPVSLRATGTCIYAYGELTYDGQTVTAQTPAAGS
jgi:hypothetical protein